MTPDGGEMPLPPPYNSPLKNGLVSAEMAAVENCGHFERLAETCFGQPSVEKARESFSTD